MESKSKQDLIEAIDKLLPTVATSDESKSKAAKKLEKKDDDLMLQLTH
jgi:SpoU rRNA methylase family enzyme